MQSCCEKTITEGAHTKQFFSNLYQPTQSIVDRNKRRDRKSTTRSSINEREKRERHQQRMSAASSLVLQQCILIRSAT